MARIIYVGGRPHRVDDNATESDVRRIANVADDHFLTMQNSDTQGYKIFDERTKLPKGSNDLHMLSLPRYEQGFDHKKKRILQEVSKISMRYPVQIDDNNLNYTLKEATGVTHWQSIVEQLAVTYSKDEIEALEKENKEFVEDEGLCKEENLTKCLSNGVKILALMTAGMRDNWEDQTNKMR